jgi:hypothetical protein
MLGLECGGPRRNRTGVVVPECDFATSASSCAALRCGSCEAWLALPVINPRNLGRPQRLDEQLTNKLAPGYSVIPPRNFVWMAGKTFKDGIRRTSELFMRFKTGEKELAFPLALAIREAHAARCLGEADAVVPVSPDKEEAGEIHRTRLLAHELARLLGTPAVELLSLAEPISKRRLRTEGGLSAGAFEAAYGRALHVDPATGEYDRIVLVDDVCTEGSTLSACATALWEVNPNMDIVPATAGQMTVRAAVKHEADLVL